MLHSQEKIGLATVEGAEPLVDKKPAIAAQRGQRRAKVMHGPCQEICPELIVLLELQVGVEQAVEQIVHVAGPPCGGTRAGRPGVVLTDGVFEERSKSRRPYWFQENTG